jgi:hypothetical protein
VLIPINGKCYGIDWCIHHIVAALNAAGIQTVASCCGHGRVQGRIDLEDGRTLFIDRSAQGFVVQNPLSEEDMQTLAEHGPMWASYPESEVSVSTGGVEAGATSHEGSIPSPVLPKCRIARPSPPKGGGNRKRRAIRK